MAEESEWICYAVWSWECARARFHLLLHFHLPLNQLSLRDQANSVTWLSGHQRAVKMFILHKNVHIHSFSPLCFDILFDSCLIFFFKADSMKKIYKSGDLYIISEHEVNRRGTRRDLGLTFFLIFISSLIFLPLICDHKSCMSWLVGYSYSLSLFLCVCVFWLLWCC